MYCMRSELQNMNDGGSIVNASSIAGLIGFPKHAAYTAAKHGTPFKIVFQIPTNNQSCHRAFQSSSKRSRRPKNQDKLHSTVCISPTYTYQINLTYISGPIDTTMHRAAAEKSSSEKETGSTVLNWQIKRVGRADEAAALIAWLLCPMSMYITGTVQVIDGGWTC